MAKFFKQKKNELIEYDGENECKECGEYRYGSLNKECYHSDDIPRCNICGGELKFLVKRNHALILGCLNDNCPTNNTNKGGDIKLKAFLPDGYYQNIKKHRKTHSNYFSIEYQMSTKNISREEAEKTIENYKNNISKKNKGHNAQYYINKFGEESYNDKIQNIKKTRKNCVEYWLNLGYNEDEAKLQISNHQKELSLLCKNRVKITKEYIKSKGIDPDQYNKRKSILCVEYWINKGFTEDEAKIKISEIQSKNSRNNHNRVSNKSIDYWIKHGYSENEARQKISEIQSTFSLEKCIKKYGEIEGRKKWEIRQEKWQKSLHENGNLHIGYSDVSQELFNELLKHYPEEERDYVFYATKNREYSLKNKRGKYYYAYDFTDLNKRKIIEFNGDIYHANPNIFNDNDKPNPFYKNLSSKDIHLKDKEKTQLAKDNGFDIITIWELDYHNNKEKTIQKILNFINNG